MMFKIRAPMTLLSILLAFLIVGPALAGTPAPAAKGHPHKSHPTAPGKAGASHEDSGERAKIRDLQQQVETLKKDLEAVKGGGSGAAAPSGRDCEEARRRLHWSTMPCGVHADPDVPPPITPSPK